MPTDELDKLDRDAILRWEDESPAPGPKDYGEEAPAVVRVRKDCGATSSPSVGSTQRASALR